MGVGNTNQNINGENVMDNLQYDSFYKFIVSIGTVLVIVPLFCLHFLISGSYDIIISKSDMDNLSQLSIDLLNMKSSYINTLLQYLPVTCIILMIIGFLCIIWGCYKWHNIQQTVLDKISQLDLQEKELHIQSMTAQEVAEKALKEDMETYEATDNTHFSFSTSSTRIRKGFEIEDSCFKYLKTKLSPKYNVYQNVKVGNYEYDIIAHSQNDDTDFLYEIKYRTHPISLSDIREIIRKVELAGTSYENTTHRSFCINVLIVTTADIIQSIKPKFIERLEGDIPKYIKCKFVEENQLNSI